MSDGSGDFYEEYAKAADRLVFKSLKSLEDALDAEKEYGVTCRYCKKHFRTLYPDYSARLKASEFLRDTGKGKPAQQQPLRKKDPKARSMEELSDEELLALIKEDEDGETVGGAA